MSAPPDIAPLGFFGEALGARITGASVSYDEHQLRDVRIHVASAREHDSGAQEAQSRGDVLNAAIEWVDGRVNNVFAWLVASRIVDRSLRRQAFKELES